jgi:CBS domain-containing protein
MSKDVAAIGADDAVERAIQLMVKRKVHRLPVVERGKVVGVVTRGDILRGFFRSLPQ